ncbi:FAD-binding protein [Psychrobacter sp. JCM 18903]|uniref:FAD-binding oxidoreductase n=1 Tax=Psychrobacter sp. JCM 18903 TaxID=1298610 RepID=UPI0004B784C7|nr:FAD-binding protein [Psychrobacter sp. JCM 18903]
MSKIKALIRKRPKSDPSKAISVNSDNQNTNNASIDAASKGHAVNTPIEQTRWNGWGNININKKVSAHGAKLIKSHIGKTKKLSSVSLQQVLKTVPKSRLPVAMTELDTVSVDNEVRLRHARGQSFPDWIAMHGGDFEVFPDGVAFPASTADVETLLQLASEHDLIVIPFGGGTSVAGHINPQKAHAPY